MPLFWVQTGSVEQGSHAQENHRFCLFSVVSLKLHFFISLTTGSCFSSTREALSELSSTNWRGGARGKGTKPRRKMGESRSQRLSLIPSDWDGNIPLADHRNMTSGGSKKRGGTIRLVKSVQLVQRTRGRFPGCLTEVSFCGKNQRLE